MIKEWKNIMNDILYCVVDQEGSIIAKDMNLNNVLLFIRALFETYCMSDNVSYTIKQQDERKE